MYVTLKYDFPISDFDVIPAGTQLKVVDNWYEYTGFIAVKYRQGTIYLNSLYFNSVPILVSL
jgi:hypothetical protein